MNASALWGIFPALPPVVPYAPIVVVGGDRAPRGRRTDRRRGRPVSVDLTGRVFGDADGAHCTIESSARLGGRFAWAALCWCGARFVARRESFVVEGRIVCSRRCPGRRHAE